MTKRPLWIPPRAGGGYTFTEPDRDSPPIPPRGPAGVARCCDSSALAHYHMNPDGTVHQSTEGRDAEPSQVRKLVSYMPLTHAMLVDFTDHVCDQGCPPPYVPEPVSFRRRASWAGRRLWWRVKRIPGLRIAHKDRIDQQEDR